jgi:hypothetical protein
MKGRREMKSMHNLWLAVLAFVFLGGVTACAGTGEMMGKDDMMAKDDAMAKEGTMDKKMEMKPEIHAMLVGSDGHQAAGKVSFGKGMNSSHKLILSDIKVDKVPDGYVYLSKGGDWMHGVQVGMLKQFTGTVSFDLHASVNPEDYDTVVIWCKKFNVEIGRATYGKKM